MESIGWIEEGMYKFYILYFLNKIVGNTVITSDWLLTN